MTALFFATKTTRCHLPEIMLRDSAHIQMQEAEYRNRKGKRSGKEKVEPIYDLNDAVSALSGFRGVDYGETVELGEGIRIRFIDAGHLLGSASIEMWITEQGITKKLVFSGDIGNFDKQTEFLIHELKNSYPGVWNKLKKCKDLKQCSDLIVTKYERPAGCNTENVKNKRYRESMKFFNRFSN